MIFHVRLNLISLVLMIGWGLLISPYCQAETSDEARYLDKGLDISATQSHQSYDSGSGDASQVTLSPYFVYGQWSLGSLFSWQKIRGQYQSELSYPGFDFLCSLAPAIPFPLDNELPEICSDDAEMGFSSNTESQGLNDISIYTSYNLTTDSNNSVTSIGLVYSHDNGEYANQLGSGTKELYADVSTFFFSTSTSFWVSAGYTHILSNNTEFEIFDYINASAGAIWWAMNWLRFNNSLNIQQDSATEKFYYFLNSSIRLGDTDGLSAQLGIYLFENTLGLPKNEVQAGITYSF